MAKGSFRVKIRKDKIFSRFPICIKSDYFLSVSEAQKTESFKLKGKVEF